MFVNRIINIADIIVERAIRCATSARTRIDDLGRDQEEPDRSTFPIGVAAEFHLSCDIGDLGFDRAVKDDESVVGIGDIISKVIPSECVLVSSSFFDKAKGERIARRKDFRNETRFIDDVDALIERCAIENPVKVLRGRDWGAICLKKLSHARRGHHDDQEMKDSENHDVSPSNSDAPECAMS